jgi:hypothetical protein
MHYKWDFGGIPLNTLGYIALEPNRMPSTIISQPGAYLHFFLGAKSAHILRCQVG